MKKLISFLALCALSLSAIAQTASNEHLSASAQTVTNSLSASAQKKTSPLTGGLGGLPILPGFHADPEILYSTKTKKYYIYSTTDGTPGWGGHDFSVFSSTNLIDWKDEGKMLDVATDQVPWADGNAWAPCIIEASSVSPFRGVKGGANKSSNKNSSNKNSSGKNSSGKNSSGNSSSDNSSAAKALPQRGSGEGAYYFYFSANNPVSKRKEIGVAVSDDPVGPFKALDHPIVTDANRPEGRRGQAIDVDVFQDPVTKKYYLYWGNGFSAGAELNDDMLSIKPETTVDLTPKGGTLKTWAYREGTYIFYRKGKYYQMWSVDDTGSPNYHVCYATASNPLGPYTVDPEHYMVIQQSPKDSIFGTAHNSVIQIPSSGKAKKKHRGESDEWYIVYHRINKAYMGDNYVQKVAGVHREVCIDRMTFDKDGNIIPVTPTLDGPAPLTSSKKK